MTSAQDAAKRRLSTSLLAPGRYRCLAGNSRAVCAGVCFSPESVGPGVSWVLLVEVEIGLFLVLTLIVSPPSFAYCVLLVFSRDDFLSTDIVELVHCYGYSSWLTTNTM